MANQANKPFSLFFTIFKLSKKILQVQNSVDSSRLHFGLEGLPALVPGFDKPAKSISQIFPLTSKKTTFRFYAHRIRIVENTAPFFSRRNRATPSLPRQLTQQECLPSMPLSYSSSLCVAYNIVASSMLANTAGNLIQRRVHQLGLFKEAQA